MMDRDSRMRDAYGRVPNADDVYPVPKVDVDLPPRRKGQAEIPEGAIIPTGENAYKIGNWELTPVGLVMPDEFTREEFHRILEAVRSLSSTLQWVIADLLVQAEQFGISIQDFAEATGYETGYLYQLKFVASKVPLQVRFPAPLSISHHRAVASLPVHEQRQWLEWAWDTGASVKALRGQIKGEGDKKKERTPIEDAYDTVLKKVSFIASKADKQTRLYLAQQLEAMAQKLRE